MSAQEHLENLIMELNFKAELDLPDVEEDGSLYYSFAHKFDFMMKASDTDDQIVFYAHMLEGFQNRKGLYKKLLTHNFLLWDTNGAVFAIDKTNGDIGLCRVFSTRDLDAIAFEEHVNSFLHTAENWHEKLQDWIQQEAQDGSKKKSISSLDPFLVARA